MCSQPIHQKHPLAMDFFFIRIQLPFKTLSACTFGSFWAQSFNFYWRPMVLQIIVAWRRRFDIQILRYCSRFSTIKIFAQLSHTVRCNWLKVHVMKCAAIAYDLAHIETRGGTLKSSSSPPARQTKGSVDRRSMQITFEWREACKVL